MHGWAAPKEVLRRESSPPRNSRKSLRDGLPVLRMPGLTKQPAPQSGGHQPFPAANPFYPLGLGLALVSFQTNGAGQEGQREGTDLYLFQFLFSSVSWLLWGESPLCLFFKKIKIDLFILYV